MADKVVMPQLGESIAEGTIVKWLKQPGDAVKKDEDLLVISTDKVEAEIPCPSTGVLLSIDVAEGETVDVGVVLGYVGEAGEASPGAGTAPSAGTAPAAKKAEPAPAPPAAAPPTPAPVVASGPPASTAAGRFVSPLVRRIAADQGISDGELDGMSGTGNNGRVTKKDLLRYVEDKKAGRVTAPAAAAPRASSTAPPFAAAQINFAPGAGESVQAASGMRKVIMKNMVASKATSAHVTTFFEVDYTAIDQVRAGHKSRFKAEEGISLTYTAFVCAATSIVLKRHPYINAEIRGTDIVFKKDVHLGIAVAIDKPEPGLMVPVIRNTDQLNLRGVAKAIADLGFRTRNRKIMPDELSGGTFTITNPGNYGAIIGTPVINQPQVAILGMGNIGKQAVVMTVDSSDVIAIRRRGWLCLSFDHRLVDGATADIFMADLKQTLETWTIAP